MKKDRFFNTDDILGQINSQKRASMLDNDGSILDSFSPYDDKKMDSMRKVGKKEQDTAADIAAFNAMHRMDRNHVYPKMMTEGLPAKVRTQYGEGFIPRDSFVTQDRLANHRYWTNMYNAIGKAYSERLGGNRTVDVSDMQSQRYEYKKPVDRLNTSDELREAGKKPESTKVVTADIPSTAIDRIRYNPETKVLQVRFRGGTKMYAFPNVDRDVVAKWFSAPSKGKYYHAAVKPYSVKTFRYKGLA